MSGDHEWVSRTGRPWSLRVRSDQCATCGHTPDAHPTHAADRLTAAERYAAAAILDRINADPDDDAAIVARAALRLAVEQARLAADPDPTGQNSYVRDPVADRYEASIAEMQASDMRRLIVATQPSCSQCGHSKVHHFGAMTGGKTPPPDEHRCWVTKCRCKGWTP